MPKHTEGCQRESTLTEASTEPTDAAPGALPDTKPGEGREKDPTFPRDRPGLPPGAAQHGLGWARGAAGAGWAREAARVLRPLLHLRPCAARPWHTPRGAATPPARASGLAPTASARPRLRGLRSRPSPSSIAGLCPPPAAGSPRRSLRGDASAPPAPPPPPASRRPRGRECSRIPRRAERSGAAPRFLPPPELQLRSAGGGRSPAAAYRGTGNVPGHSGSTGALPGGVRAPYPAGAPLSRRPPRKPLPPASPAPHAPGAFGQAAGPQSLDKSGLRGDLSALYDYLEGGGGQGSVGLFSRAARDGTRGHGLSLHQGSGGVAVPGGTWHFVV